jgi:hypothetical protein
MNAAGGGWWIALLLAVSACATSSPRKPVERAARAATDAAEEGPPECGAPRADTLEDGLVVIRPGETICVAVTSWKDVVTPVRVVSSTATDGAARPIILRSWRDGSDVYLTIRNPYARYLKYRAAVVLPGEVRPRDTKTCAVLTDYRPTLEHWPHAIDEILLTDFRLLPEGAALACE